MRNQINKYHNHDFFWWIDWFKDQQKFADQYKYDNLQPETPCGPLHVCKHGHIKPCREADDPCPIDNDNTHYRNYKWFCNDNRSNSTFLIFDSETAGFLPGLWNQIGTKIINKHFYLRTNRSIY